MRRVYRYLLAAVFIISIWHIASLALKTPVIPTPSLVIQVLREKFFSTIFKHLFSSIKRIVLAILIAYAAALPLGMAMGRNSTLDEALAPVLYFFYPIPKIAFLPVILVLMGLGEGSKITLIAVIVFFHLAVAVRDSAAGISEEMFYTLRVMGAGKRHFLQHVVFPSILPSVFTALRISLGTSIAVLFFAETVVTDTGIGFLIMDSWIRVDYPEMYASVVGLSIMGISLFGLVDFAEYMACRWKRYS